MMKIKGFDKDLKCRGFQFKVGETYDTGAKDNELELCSGKVFHYCDSLLKVHSYYSASPKENNRFCEIEVLGAEVSDDTKCGSNKIKIIREIVGEELDCLRGYANGNTGLFNSGDHNSGHRNSGDHNSGDHNSRHRNSGDHNSGDHNSGDCNSGHYNSGYYNSGHYNSGDHNSGDCNSGHYNSGDHNSGDHNSGDCNSGHYNSGYYNSCDFSSGLFCTQDPKLIIFDVQTDMTMRQAQLTDWYKMLFKYPLILTEWTEYTEDEKQADKDKELIGKYLKTYSYKEACRNWWKQYSDDEKTVIMSMPNFDKNKFKMITGIEVER